MGREKTKWSLIGQLSKEPGGEDVGLGGWRWPGSLSSCAAHTVFEIAIWQVDASVRRMP